MTWAAETAARSAALWCFAAGTERLAEAEDRERAGQQRGENAEHQEGLPGLRAAAALSARSRQPVPIRRHGRDTRALQG
jgi:hypothetical protein